MSEERYKRPKRDEATMGIRIAATSRPSPLPMALRPRERFRLPSLADA